jgi:hypothetical protein
MINEQAAQNISEFFNKRTVEFGDVPRYNDQSTWPFWLSLIPENTNPTLFPQKLTQSLTGLGWPVNPQSYIDIPIQTQQDALYHVISHKLSIMRGPATGSITCLADDTAVVGVGTSFTTEYQVGDIICVNDDLGQARFGVVAVINTDLSITLHAPFGPNAVTAKSSTTFPADYRIGNQWYEMPALTGGIQVAGVNVTGIGTLFTTQLNVGQNIAYVTDSGVHAFATIATITNNTTMTFATSPGDVAGVAGVAFKLCPLPKGSFNSIRPLTTYVRESMIMKSNGTVYLYGGDQDLLGSAVYIPASLGAGGNGLMQRPVKTTNIQGIKDGFNNMYHPFQMPREGTIFLRVHNTHTRYKMYINGSVFGYKVAI